MELSFIENLLKECPSTLVFTIVLLILSIVFYKLMNKDLPPGPWGLPIVGYWPYLGLKSSHKELKKLTEKYGDILSFRIAGKLFIHLGSFKSVREANLTKSDCFTTRNTDFNMFLRFNEQGVLGGNGEQWKTLRKFYIQKFREFGLTSLKDVSGFIYDSVNTSVKNLEATNGTPVDIISILSLHITTVLYRMLLNDYGTTSEEITELLENYEAILVLFQNKKILLTGKLAKYILLPFDHEYNHATKCQTRIDFLLRKIFKRHKDTLDEQNIRNMIDSFYKEKNERERKGDPTSIYFTDTSLVSSMLQFLGDGVVGVSAFIGVFINALVEYPDEQEKIYKELEDVLGPERQPCLDDKNNLPYTNAFLLEVGRMMDFFPIFPGSECTKETTLGDYKIPKGAVTVVNIYAVHRDPKVYEEPDVFKPSRFLKGPGKEKADSPIVFGLGKRTCMGESFINMQTFLCVTTLVKNFRLELPEGVKNETVEKVTVIAHPRMNK